MLSDNDFVKRSLEINLFFLRILKEHSFFLEVSFPPQNYHLKQQACMLKYTFEHLLIETINLSYGKVPIKNDALTEYTYEAEKVSEALLGTPLNTNITLHESAIEKQTVAANLNLPPMFTQNIYQLNSRAINAAHNIVRFKTIVLDNVLNCSLYTTNYPLLIEHIRREAIFYIDLLTKLQNRMNTYITKEKNKEKKTKNDKEEMIKKEIFWNQIMAEHAKFVRGLLDPTEDVLIKSASNYGKQFDSLTAEALKSTEKNLSKVTKNSLNLTKEFKQFKEQGTEGILNCQIKSIIIPLLADHILREANHYLDFLEKTKKS